MKCSKIWVYLAKLSSFSFDIRDSVKGKPFVGKMENALFLKRVAILIIKVRVRELKTSIKTCKDLCQVLVVHQLLFFFKGGSSLQPSFVTR